MKLQRELNDFRDKQRMEAMMKQFVTTRNMEVQTDPPKTLNVNPPKKTDKAQQDERMNKLLAMHNSLLRRYERELKANMEHVETITDLNIKLNDAEQKQRECDMRVHRVEKEKQEVLARQADKARTSCSQSCHTTDNSQRRLIEKTGKERDKLSQELKAIKKEIKGLDYGFFEEVEDLKFALEESTRLNQQYDHTLRRMCQQQGLPFPMPSQSNIPPAYKQPVTHSQDFASARQSTQPAATHSKAYNTQHQTMQASAGGAKESRSYAPQPSTSHKQTQPSKSRPQTTATSTSRREGSQPARSKSVR